MYNYSNKKTNRLFGDIEYHLKCKGIFEESDYVKLANQIGWDELCEPLEGAYCMNNGRGAINVRTILGLEILKHMLKLSDEKMVHQLQTNLEVQYFCGIQNMYENTRIESSSMTHFRNRIGDHPEIKEAIQNIHLKDTIRKLPKKRQGQYDQDSTVVNESIKYPNDIALLNDVIQKGAKLIEKGKERCGTVFKKMVAVGKRQAKKIYLAYNFAKGKSRKSFEDTKQEMIKLGKKMIDIVDEGYQKMKYLKHEGNKQLQRGKKEIKQFIELGSEVISQQKKLLKISLDEIKQGVKHSKQSVKNRIISLSKPYIRTIMKGKKGKKVQFGAKAQIGVVGGKIAVMAGMTRENEHDSKHIKKGIEIVKKVRGKLPSEVGYDKGGRGKEIYNYLKENNIVNGIQGSEEYEKLPRVTRKRLYNRRAFNENVINDVLNHRGVNNNKYSQKNTEWNLIMGCMASNLIRVR